MRKIVITGVALVCVVGSAVALASSSRGSSIREFLTGLKEVPVVTAHSTPRSTMTHRRSATR
jgi:hypothetical protein